MICASQWLNVKQRACVLVRVDTANKIQNNKLIQLSTDSCTCLELRICVSGQVICLGQHLDALDPRGLQQIFIQTTKSTSTQNKHHNTHQHILRNVCIPITAIGPAWSKSVHATYLETDYLIMYGVLSLSLSLHTHTLYLETDYLPILLPSDTTHLMLHLASDYILSSVALVTFGFYLLFF